jgi:hypothetical protein
MMQTWETLQPYPDTCSGLIGAGVAGDTSIWLDEDLSYTFVVEPIKRFGSPSSTPFGDEPMPFKSPLGEFHMDDAATAFLKAGSMAVLVSEQTKKLTDAFMIPAEFIIPTTGFGAPSPLEQKKIKEHNEVE